MFAREITRHFLCCAVHKKNRFNNSLGAYERKNKFLSADDVPTETRVKLGSMNECFYKGQLREAQQLAVEIIRDTRALLLDPFQLIAAITSAELATWPADKGPVPRELYMKRYQALLVQVMLSTHPPLSTLQALADAAEHAKPIDWQIDVTLACMQASGAEGGDLQQLANTCLRGALAGAEWLTATAGQTQLDTRAVRTISNRVSILANRCSETLDSLLAEHSARAAMQAGASPDLDGLCSKWSQYAQVAATNLQCNLRFGGSMDKDLTEVIQMCERAASVAKQAADAWAVGQQQGASDSVLHALNRHTKALGECIVRWAFQFEQWALCEIVPEQLTAAGIQLLPDVEAREVIALWLQIDADERKETADGVRVRLKSLAPFVFGQVKAGQCSPGSHAVPQCGVDRRSPAEISEERYKLQQVHFVVKVVHVLHELDEHKTARQLIQSMRSSKWHVVYPHVQHLMSVILLDDARAENFEVIAEDSLLFLQSAADPWQVWQDVARQLLMAAQVPFLARLASIVGPLMPELAAQKSVTRRCVRDVRAAFVVCSLLHFAPQGIFVDDEYFVTAVLGGLWAAANHAADAETAVMRMRAALHSRDEALLVQNMTSRAVLVVQGRQGADSAAAAECKPIQEQCRALLEAFDSDDVDKTAADDDSIHDEQLPGEGAAAASLSAAKRKSKARRKKRSKKRGQGGDEVSSTDSDSSFKDESSESSDQDALDDLDDSESSSSEDGAAGRRPSRVAPARKALQPSKRTGRAVALVRPSRRTTDYRILFSRILSSSSVPSLSQLSSLYFACRSAASLPWANSLVSLLGRLELSCTRPHAALCCTAMDQGDSIYCDAACQAHRAVVVPPSSFKRVSRDAIAAKVSVPLLMAAVNKLNDVVLAMSLLVYMYDTWRAMLRPCLPNALRRDVHHTATVHHPLLDLLDSSLSLRYLASRSNRSRHATFMRSLASINAYAALRPSHAEALPDAALPYLSEEDKAWVHKHQLSDAAVDVEVHFNLGRWYNTVGLLPAAREHYCKAMQISADCEHFSQFREQRGFRHPADLGLDAAVALLILLEHHTPNAQWSLPPEQQQLLQQQLVVGALPQGPHGSEAVPSRGVLDRM